MKISVVVDNGVPISVKKPFTAEHGFSLLVEHAGRKILFDTGWSSAVVSNLSLLGVHPSEIDTVVVSHGHYDHTGGLYYILQYAGKKMPIYAHSNIFQPRYSTAGEMRQFIGLPYTREQLTVLGAEWRFVDGPVELLPGLWVSGEIPKESGFESGDARLVVCGADGCDCQDDIPDDLALFFSGPKGMVVIGGCTHSGLVNTVRYGLKLTGAARIAGWVGGTHLGPVPAEQQEKTMAELESLNPDFIAANHCTGFAMMARLHARFGSRFIPAYASTVIDI
jgi:7,8-dihydropterin-6-yl-methyl-4-(beta-D-ribofuranosyl)aminobenzene 5'-phosphate synthase